jgi:phage terminase Nu1 subunit (DNA packaging protein)
MRERRRKANSSTRAHLSLSAYARHRKERGLPGGSESGVRQAVSSRRLVRSVTRAGKIRDAELADAEWSANTAADCVPITGPTAPKVQPVAPASFSTARSRHEAAKAELAELELAKRRRELLPAADVASRIAGVFTQCKTKILGVPARLRQLDPALTEAQLRLFEEELREALEDLAAGPDVIIASARATR